MRQVLTGIILLLVPLFAASAQDFTRLGGDLTSDLPGRHAIQVTAPNVSSEARKQVQLAGFTLLHRLTSVGEGLGPTFVNSSCGGCHVNNGRGPARFSRAARGNSAMIVKVRQKGKLNADGSPVPVPGLGFQVQNHSVRGRSKTSVSLTWQSVRGTYPDGTRYTLRKPTLDLSIQGASTRRIATSLRMTPVLIGTGLLEAIPEASILALSDPEDANGDGISGRPNYVPDLASGTRALGRFGFRASHPTLAQQTGAAAFFDMGVTNSLFSSADGTAELNAEDFERLVVYQQIAGVPPARDQSNPEVQAGRAIFETVGCASCHITTFVTSSTADPEVASQTIHPFTDLLLHDMGRDLSDGGAEFSAFGSEWRTTPLWGIGFSETLSTVKPLYLHDGRARSVEEAILWHGGEAAAARNAFKALEKEKRLQLIRFLRSL